ncbi:hydantoinase B/oxoprolinase family protein [soil metagenome]
MSTNPESWQIWIDTGGTFTDCIALTPSSKTVRLKVLSSSVLRGKITRRIDSTAIEVKLQWPVSKDIFKNFEIRIAEKNFSASISSVNFQKSIIRVSKSLPSNINDHSIEITSNEEVPVFATRLLTETSIAENFPLLEMKLGSTKGTNAILERKGAKTIFLVTKGFKDLLLIGNQQRPDLFTTNVIKPLPLYTSVLEVDERIGSEGDILKPLSQFTIDLILRQLKNIKAESIAISLLNSYRNSAHEEQLALALKANGFKYISTSSSLSTQIKILPRAETAVANAYLDPIINSYIAGIKRGLAGSSLNIMNSAGNLVKSDSFYPKDSLLSGPAGGVVGAVNQAALSGIRKIIAFDMGGTSTDVSLYNNRFNYQFESIVGNLKILSPSLAIETIAAGGGSICDFDGHRFTVGPHSAGASPGPACYGTGGPLTITDVNLLLGRLDPQIFSIPIYPDRSEAALNTLLKKIKRVSGQEYKPRQVLESLVQIANEKMAEAIKKISVQLGHDPQNFTLLSFGGAGGQHACALADMLNMNSILIPYDAGLLSAYGIGHATIERFEEMSILQNWKKFLPDFKATLELLFSRATQKLKEEGNKDEEIYWKKSLLFLRFVGQDSTIEIEYNHGDVVEDLFRQKYISVYGHWIDRSLEIESIKIIASVKAPTEPSLTTNARKYFPVAKKRQFIFSQGKRRKGNVHTWEDFVPGATIAGPALIISGNSTTFVETNWIWSLDTFNNGHLRVEKKGKRRTRHTQEAELELFTNRFTAVAQEMGALLQRTSFSVNVKERLDFSCAVLDANGYLVVNAPHIPVHLGSMGVCVREVAKAIVMKDGDVVITNHPAFGGSHLPDVTVIKPVFYKNKLIGYVANRAHHSEIGGKKPGSMPADATALEEEGVIISPMYLIVKGNPQWNKVKEILSKGEFPTRSLDENIADLNAALASVNLGEDGLKNLCLSFGERNVTKQMNALRQYASSVLTEKIRKLEKNSYSATEYLDDGSVLQVKIWKKKDRLTIDFTGSSGVHPGNLNATKAIVQSVILYSLRLLVDQPLPMNEGLMDPVELVLPNGLLNPDFSNGKLPAVVGGNTEVSQRLTDTLLKAFGLAACSQGTMNNFLFGNDRFGYYETICGGTGAGNGFNGTNAVHQHMTNTRITDPEILELRYPVRLNRFEIRKNSGGKGKWTGGNGVEREITFKADLEINLLTQHRKEKPYGFKGGAPGKTGEQTLIHSEGTKQKLKGMESLSVKKGDKLIIRTPGGGGYGKH